MENQKDDRDIKIENLGNNFKITTTSKQYKTKVIEDKDSSEFITWFGTFTKELDEIRKERGNLMSKIAQLNIQTKEIDERTKKIKEDMNACKDIESLKAHLASVFSGRMQNEEQLKSGMANINYLQNKENNITKFISNNKEFHVKALRMNNDSKKGTAIKDQQ